MQNSAAADFATASILSNFKCQKEPPRLVFVGPPSGYDLPRYPPVAWWGVHLSFEKHPNTHAKMINLSKNFMTVVGYFFHVLPLKRTFPTIF